jgi:hypothetical protein
MTLIDEHVWHDGEFPFGEDHDGEPRRLHHCSAGQFIRFGQLVQEMDHRRLA